MNKLKKENYGRTVNIKGYSILLDTVRPHQVEILELEAFFDKVEDKKKSKKDS